MSAPVAERLRGVKLSNEYAEVLGALYATTPKAVLAAVVVSLLNRHIATLDATQIGQALLDEWDTLHANGIVPQPSPRLTR